MQYEGIVYRPPSEARSLIVQLTVGCARNTCTFCSMYKDKRFRVRPLPEVMADLGEGRLYFPQGPRRVFLADGDALIVKTADLLTILEYIHRLYPRVERISMYGAPADILAKSHEELVQLQKAGLDMVYVGVESGDDRVLTAVKKGVTAAQIVEAGQKLKRAGIRLSMTLISGLGGRELLESHAVESARVISAIKPEYVGFLTLMVEPGTPLYDKVNRGEFQLLGPDDVVEEMELFLKNVDSEGSVFRANHASNYVNLAGDLNRDIPMMLAQLERAKRTSHYKPEGWRGL